MDTAIVVLTGWTLTGLLLALVIGPVLGRREAQRPVDVPAPRAPLPVAVPRLPLPAVPDRRFPGLDAP